MIKYILPFFIFLNLAAIENDSELEQLKAQAHELLERINAYELKKSLAPSQSSAVKKTPPTPPADFKPIKKDLDYITDDVAGNQSPMNQKGFLELNNPLTTINIGGRIDLQSFYGWPEGVYYADKIPLHTTGEQAQLLMSARDSRLWFKTRTPSKYGTIRTLIETDFGGTQGTEINTNSHGLRLRHAYIQLDRFLAGQTNSAFNVMNAPDTITDAINDTFVRQPLIRYSIEDGKLGYDISFEQPETTLLANDAEVITPKDDKFPDIIARVRYYPSWGEASIAFLNRYIAQDGYYPNTKDAAYGWGLNLSTKIKVFELDDIRFNAQYGVGLGRYLSYDAFKAGTIDQNGNIHLQSVYGSSLSYRHWWSPSWRSTLALSTAGSVNHKDEILVADRDKVNKAVYGSQLNLLWIPIPNTILGLEYAKARRYVESDESANMDLIILLVRYDF